MPKRLAIIPARGGSKRIPKKNIKDFCGKPIISYILDTVRASNLFDTIHVSTDSEEISSVVESLGIPIEFLRPQKLSDDITPIMPVLKFVVNEYQKIGKSFDEIWLLMPCAPLLESKDLINSSKIFSTSTCSLQSIVEYPVPIEWAFKASDNRLSPVKPGMFAVRSQDLEKKYYDAGAFYIFSPDSVINSEGAGRDDNYIGYVLPKSKVIDIDDIDDWTIAEALYLTKQNKSNNKQI